MNIPRTQFHLLLKLHDEVKLSLVALSDPVAVRDTIGGHLDLLDAGHVVKLVHGVVLATSLECSVSREILLVIVSDVGASHVLVLDTRQTLPDLPPLNILNIGQHCLGTKVAEKIFVRKIFQFETKKIFTPW